MRVLFVGLGVLVGVLGVLVGVFGFLVGVIDVFGIVMLYLLNLVFRI